MGREKYPGHHDQLASVRPPASERIANLARRRLCAATRRDGQPCRAPAAIAWGTALCREHGRRPKGSIPPEVRKARTANILARRRDYAIIIGASQQDRDTIGLALPLIGKPHHWARGIEALNHMRETGDATPWRQWLAQDQERKQSQGEGR